jgi:type IV pilus assembly protein PilC
MRTIVALELQVIAVLFIVLTMVSLPQLLWTWRSIRRVRQWLDNDPTLLELGRFARFSRWLCWYWLIGLAVPVTIYLEEFNRGVFSLESLSLMIASAIVALWCLLLFLVSVKSVELCGQANRLAMIRQLGDQGLDESELRFGSLVGPLVTAHDLRNRLTTLSRLTLFLLALLLLCLVVVLETVAAVHLIAVGMDNIGSRAGLSLLLLGSILAPSSVVLYFVRAMVQARSQRAQFLWFLAATTQTQRSLATELLAWGKSQAGPFGSRIIDVARAIGRGEPLPDAIERHRNLVSPSDLLSIRVAVSTNTLPETLRACAARQTASLKSDSWFGNATSSIVWLWSVVITAITIVSFLIVFIVPKFRSIFEHFGTELPGVTRAVIQLSEHIEVFAPILIPTIVCISIVVLWSCGQAYFVGWSETWLAWRLGFGRDCEIPRLLRRLHGAVLGQQPLPVALRPMVLKHPQESIRSRLERVLGRVTAGMGIWPAMHDAGLLSARDVNLLEMAERVHNLDWALNALAESKEQSLSQRWQLFLAMIVPVSTILAGIVVLMICVAFFMPLIKLLHDLS